MTTSTRASSPEKGSEKAPATSSGLGLRVRARQWATTRLIARPELWLLTVLSLITRLIGLTSPKAVVFDEVYFKVAAGDYRTGKFFFDPHPPLAKELLALFSWMMGVDANGLANDKHPDVVVRYLPALAGAMLVPIVWTIMRQLGAKRRVAFLGGLAVLLDNALLVESRFILTDAIMFCFGMLAVALYLAARARTGWKFWAFAAGSALAAGGSLSTKWTGMAPIAAIAVIWIWDFVVKVREGTIRVDWVKPAALVAIFAVLPLTVYLGSFWVHFALLTHTGSGDGWMNAQFQKTLIGSPTYDPKARMSFLAKVFDANHGAKLYEEGVEHIGHPYGSHWNQWPFMNRDIYYWAGPSNAEGSQQIYLLGNPAVWWGAIVGTIVVAANMLFGIRRFRGSIFALTALGVGWLADWLPFERITRVMFLYHYFFALMFSIMFALVGVAAMMGWNTVSDDTFFSGWNWRRDWLWVTIAGLIVLGFIFIAPLSYGWTLSPDGLEARMLLSKWR